MTATRFYLLIGLATTILAFMGACTGEPHDPTPQGSECGQNAVIGCYDEFAHEEVSLTCVLPTSRWNKTALTWRLIGRLDRLDEEAQLRAVKDAIDAWGDASALTFEELSETENTDITIRFVTGDHKDPFPFIQTASVDQNVLGHAFFPSFPGFRDPQYSAKAGDVHICSNELWALVPDDGAVDLFTVVLHELGHALGLPHSADPDAVMYPEYPVAGFRALPTPDVTAILRLYGSEDGSVPPVPVARSTDVCAPANYLNSDIDPDSDGDGLPDTVEVFVVGTDPLDADTDDDGVSDGDEVLRDRTSALFANTPDQDGDGLPDAREMELGTKLDDTDSDDDGLVDGEEVLIGTNPLDPNSDDDCLLTDGDDPFPSFPAECALFPFPCDDGLFCNGAETRLNDECILGEAPCAPDQCDEESDLCMTPPEPCTPETCDNDGLFCTGTEACMNGECESPGDPCVALDLLCDEETKSCVQCFEDGQCNDDSECTMDACIEHVCTHTPNPCDDADACTTDTCVDNLCVHVPGACGGGGGGNGGDACTGVTCNDGNACTNDTCVNGGCISTPVNCPDDGLFCNGNESCGPLTGVCASSGNPCTGIQICDEAGNVCVAAPCAIDADCDDSNACTNDACVNNGCQNSPVNCDDDVACTDDACDPILEECQNTNNCTGGRSCFAQLGECEGCFMLTLGMDNFVGDADDDCFEAPLMFNPPTGTTVPTLQSGDTLNGGGGPADPLADSMMATFNYTVPTTVTPTMIGIETINIVDFGTGATTFAGVRTTGLLTINVIASTNPNALTFNGLANVVDAGISNSTSGLTLGYAPGATSAMIDDMSLRLSAVSAGTFNITSATTNGVEILNIVSDGNAANTLTIIAQTVGTTMATINVNGTQALTIINALPNSVATVNASGSSGGVVVDVSGNISNVTVAGGVGNDTFILGANYTTNDTVNGGPGTANTLGLTSATAAAASNQGNVTNIQRLTIIDGLVNPVTVSRFGSVGTVNLRRGFLGAATLTVPAGATVNMGTNNAPTDSTANGTVDLTGQGTADTMTMTLNDHDTNSAYVFTGVESLNLESNNRGDGNPADAGANVIGGALTLTPTFGTAIINLTGAANLTITRVVTAGALNASIAFGGNLVMTAVSANAITISSGTGNDTLFGSAAGDTLSAGAGTNVYEGNAGIDTFTLGAGRDTIRILLARANGVDRKIVAGFTAGTGGDVLNIDGDGLNILDGTDNFTTLASIQAHSADGNLTVAAATEIVRVTSGTVANFSGANSLNGTNLLAAIGGPIRAQAAGNEHLFLVADASGNIGVYYGDANADAFILADQLTLVAVLQGVTIGNLVFSNFSNAN
ncbi:MAG: matrixin family metalloprotease [Planctomycetota bacterium]